MQKVSILDFGAKPGTGDIQTRKIQDAIDYCFKNGGGEVIIPEGEYIVGDIRLRSNITLHLLENACLLGSVDPDDYLNVLNDETEPLPEEEKTDILWKSPRERTTEEAQTLLNRCASRWHYGIIRILFAKNVSVIGEKGSFIDGQNCYDEKGEQKYRGPHGINVHKSENLNFSGYTVKHTGNWAHCIFSSRNINVENVTVLGGHDGVHFRGCDNATVKNCVLKTGDDSIAGFDNLNIHVTDCILSSACNVLRFGGTNVLVENCTVEGPCEYPFRWWFTDDEKKNRALESVNTDKATKVFFTYFVDPTRNLRHKPGNIIVRNCRIKGAERFFKLNLSGSETWQKGIPPENITFENIDVDSASCWITAYGNDADKFILKMKNINFSFKEGMEQCDFMHAGNYDSIIFENVNITNFDGDKLILTWGDKNKIFTDGINCCVEKDKIVVEANELFTGNYL